MCVGELVCYVKRGGTSLMYVIGSGGKMSISRISTFFSIRNIIPYTFS